MNNNFDLIVSDLHHRITGVGATIRNLAPLQAQQHRMVLVSPFPLEGVPSIRLWHLLLILVQDRSRHRIWHARRNNEMFWALFAKHILRANLSIVFTSAAIRRHSWYPRQLIRRMDKIIATSEKAASFVDAEVVVPHGVDVERFASFSTVQRKPMLITVGRVRPEKGTDVFVDMLCQILPQYPDWTAMIVGKTTPKYATFKESLLEKLSARNLLERVQFTDEISFSDMPKIYAAASIVVMPARYEGFGLVPMEAMSAGCVPITSDTGAYAQMIESGRDGFVVEELSLTELCAKVRFVIDHPIELQRFSERAIEKSRKCFSRQKEVEGINKVYQSLWSGDQNV